MSSTTGSIVGSRRAAGERRRTGRGHERRRPAPDLDELGQDRQGDLLGRLATEIETGRGTQGGEPLFGDRRVVAEPRADDRRARRRGDEAHVRHVTCQGGGQRLLVPDPLRGDHHGRGQTGVEPGDVGPGHDPLGAREVVAGRRSDRRSRRASRPPSRA